jgi:hypothetical protein
VDLKINPRSRGRRVWCAEGGGRFKVCGQWTSLKRPCGLSKEVREKATAGEDTTGRVDSRHWCLGGGLGSGQARPRRSLQAPGFHSVQGERAALELSRLAL